MNHDPAGKGEQMKKSALSLMAYRELVGELLSKVILLLRQALDALPKRDYDVVNRSLIDAQNIFLELEATILSSDQASVETRAFLHTMAEQLFYANINKDGDMLADLLQVTRHLRTTYAYQIHEKKEP